MANFQQNGIDFTISNNLTGSEKIHSIKGKISSISNPYLDYEQDDASKLINAVEIDWNGAKPGFGEDANGITTTGELFRQDFASVA